MISTFFKITASLELSEYHKLLLDPIPGYADLAPLAYQFPKRSTTLKIFIDTYVVERPDLTCVARDYSYNRTYSSAAITRRLVTSSKPQGVDETSSRSWCIARTTG